MKSIFLVVAIFMSATSYAAPASIGKIQRIYYNVDGYVYINLVSGSNNTTECYNSAVYGSHRMKVVDDSATYQTKLSLIMMAFASGKIVQLQASTSNTASYCSIDLVVIDQS